MERGAAPCIVPVRFVTTLSSRLMKKPTRVTEVKGVAEPATAARALDAKTQTEIFGRATKVFTSGDFRKARTLFEEALNGPSLEVAESARSYIRMCEQRISKEKVDLTTPDEQYDFAVRLINERRLPEAQQHLQTALAALPNAGHIHYAMALAKGLSGDFAGAHGHLKRAIELDPQNRALARGDTDFQELLYHSELRGLLFPEKPQPF